MKLVKDATKFKHGVEISIGKEFNSLFVKPESIKFYFKDLETDANYRVDFFLENAHCLYYKFIKCNNTEDYIICGGPITIPVVELNMQYTLPIPLDTIEGMINAIIITMNPVLIGILKNVVDKDIMDNDAEAVLNHYYNYYFKHDEIMIDVNRIRKLVSIHNNLWSIINI